MSNFNVSTDNTVELSQNLNTLTLVTNSICSLPKHADSHSINGSDPLTPSDIGAQPSGNYILEGDSRLTNNRTPSAHAASHFIGGSDPITLEGIGAQPSGNYILEGDSRLSNQRTPTLHALSHLIGGSDPITPSGIGAFPVKYDDLSDNISNAINVKKRTAKAWVNFNGVGVVSIRSSFNISSITDNGTGDYTINFAIPFTDTNYCFVTWSRDWNTDNYIVNNFGARSTTSKTVSGVRLINNYIGNALNYDSLELNVIFFAV